MRLTTPTLLLDKKKCLSNIERMVKKAKENGVRLRPHFKTHQSAQVGAWFRDYNIEAITVSSLKMARYFANQGWKDILVAFPANVLEMDIINELASRIKLHLLVVNVETVEILASNLRHPVQLWVKIDTGYRRTGVLANNHKDLNKVLQRVQESDKMQFSGFLVHDGHTYKQKDTYAIQTIHNTSVYLLQLLRDRYVGQFPNLQLSIGDTPSCSILSELNGIDEIRPGNFVFYDLTQQRIGSCSFDDIAVCVACPVVARHPRRRELIIYGGAVHFSKDALAQGDSSLIYGRVVEFTNDGWTSPANGMDLVSLSQEHGIIKATAEQFAKYSIGDMIGILPVHSCLTADLMRGYMTTDGEILEHLSGVPQRELVAF